MVRAILALAVLLACPLALADIRITTWNIEHLGSAGRGIGGGFGGGNLPLRSNAQLDEIGEFIRDTLQSDDISDYFPLSFTLASKTDFDVDFTP